MPANPFVGELPAIRSEVAVPKLIVDQSLVPANAGACNEAVSRRAGKPADGNFVGREAALAEFF